VAKPRLPDETIQKIVKLRSQGLSTRDIGKQVGTDAGTVSRVLGRYFNESMREHPVLDREQVKGGPPPAQKVNEVVDRTDIDGSVDVLKMDKILSPDELMAACKLDKRVWIPQYYKPNSWEGFYKLKDGSAHRKVRLYQSKAVFKRIITEDIQAAILDFVRDTIKPFKVGELPKTRKIETKPFAVAWGIWDAHLGLYSWDAEVGSNYDIEMATKRVFNSIDDMVEELKPYNIKKLWMPVGNDFMHYDSVRMKTTFGEHHLDTDTRYAKVYEAALRCLVYMIQRALELCGDLDVMYIPGNHDFASSYTLTAALKQRFFNEPRVKVDLGACPRKIRTNGGTLIMFDHGQVKWDRYPTILGQEAKEEWSKATYREVQVGHRHQRMDRNYESVLPTNGVTVRMNPSLCNVDVWHFKQGMIGEPVKSVEAWRYDEVGYRGSHCVWARDDKNDKIEKTVV
jgi:paired box domain-containing protein